MIAPTVQPPRTFTATRNACKLCTPLGACLAFAGVAGARTILHGSQGCSTYIRRYMISHFKEPVDIASTNFSESTAVFGGRDNLRLGLENVVRQYQPQLIGVATTCLAETIGEDVGMYLREIAAERGDDALPHPPVVHVATPSYCGTHADGYLATVRALVEQLADAGPRGTHLNVFPPMVSPADLRYLKEILADFELSSSVLPDYSDTLDAPAWEEYQLIPRGGTPLAAIRAAGQARASIEFGDVCDPQVTAAAFLAEAFGVPPHRLGMPIGIARSDALFDVLQQISGRPLPGRHADERGRLIDALVDGHKYVFGKRAAVYGEEDLVIGLASLLCEIGVVPIVCASGGDSGQLARALADITAQAGGRIEVRSGADFAALEELLPALQPDLLIGNSKGYPIARKLGIPLVRTGFPIHDRIGGARLLHIGYRGAQQLFDRITNALIAAAQDESEVGYMYM